MYDEYATPFGKSLRNAAQDEYDFGGTALPCTIAAGAAINKREAIIIGVVSFLMRKNLTLCGCEFDAVELHKRQETLTEYECDDNHRQSQWNYLTKRLFTENAVKIGRRDNVIASQLIDVRFSKS